MSPDQIFIVAIVALILVVLLLFTSVIRSEEGDIEFDIFGIHIKWRFKKKSGPKPPLPEEIQKQLTATVDRYNRSWLNAIATNDYGQLRAACTAAYFVAQERKFKNDQAQRQANGANTITLESLEVQAVTMLDDHSARVQTIEHWQTTYKSGRKAIQTVPNVYSIRQENSCWYIDQVEHPTEGTTTWT